PHGLYPCDNTLRQAYAHTLTHTRAHAHTHSRTHTRAHTRAHTHTHTRAHTLAHTHSRTHTHHTHTHRHTHTPECPMRARAASVLCVRGERSRTQRSALTLIHRSPGVWGQRSINQACHDWAHLTSPLRLTAALGMLCMRCL